MLRMRMRYRVCCRNIDEHARYVESQVSWPVIPTLYMSLASVAFVLIHIFAILTTITLYAIVRGRRTSKND